MKRRIANIVLTAVMLATVMVAFTVPTRAMDVAGPTVDIANLRDIIAVNIFPERMDTYSDGRPIMDDETYVIVWTPSQFTKVNLDQTFKSNNSVKVLVNAPMAKRGYCPRIQFQIDKGYYQENNLNTGYFRLFSTNVLRKKSNNEIPFEIKEIKVTVEISNNLSLSMPGSSETPGAAPRNLRDSILDLEGARFNKLFPVGDWVVLHFSYTSNKNLEEPLIIIKNKDRSQEFYSNRNGTTISIGNIWIIIAIAFAGVVGIVVLVIVKKKKTLITTEEKTPANNRSENISEGGKQNE